MSLFPMTDQETQNTREFMRDGFLDARMALEPWAPGANQQERRAYIVGYERGRLEPSALMLETYRAIDIADMLANLK